MEYQFGVLLMNLIESYEVGIVLLAECILL